MTAHRLAPHDQAPIMAHLWSMRGYFHASKAGLRSGKNNRL